MPDKSHDADILHYKAPRGLKRTGIIALCVAVAVAAIGIGLRIYHDRQTVVWTDEASITSVKVLKLSGAKAGGDLSLPGDIEAFSNAPIYAQVSGYLQKWNVDIGAP